MTTHTQQVRHIREIPRDREVIRDTEIIEKHEDDTSEQARGQAVAARLVWFVAGILLVLLAMRFVFAALGANPGNVFVNFIYTTSHPFVTSFFGLFSYDPLRHDTSRIELFTLVAMAVYALIATALANLLTIDRRSRK